MTYFVQLAKGVGAKVEKTPLYEDPHSGYWKDGNLIVVFTIPELKEFVYACVNEELAGELSTR